MKKLIVCAAIAGAMTVAAPTAKADGGATVAAAAAGVIVGGALVGILNKLGGHHHRHEVKHVYTPAPAPTVVYASTPAVIYKPVVAHPVVVTPTCPW